MTIVVSTPYMDEMTRCDRVALIQRGQLLATDTPQRIAASFDRPLLAVHAADRYRALLALREWPRTRAVYPFGESLHYVDAREDAAADAIAPEVAAFLTSRGFAEVRVAAATPTVEDAFIARMGAPEGAHAA
jgi:ABC-2 type transport system ATP-binding protein